MAKTQTVLSSEEVETVLRAIVAVVNTQPDAMTRLQVAGGLAAGALGTLAGELCLLDKEGKGRNVEAYTPDALAFMTEMLTKNPDGDLMPEASKWITEALFASEK